MKRLIFVFIVFFGLLSMAQRPAERFSVYQLKTNASDWTWMITATADDTSETFNLFSEQSIQYCFNDTSDVWDDSVAYKIELLGSLAGVPDSSFVLIQTVTSSETNGGYRPIKIINCPVGTKGKLVVTGLSGNTKIQGLWGRIFIGGWSNAEGMASQLR